MRFKRESACYASIAMFVILVTMVFACASVIPAAKATANGLTYYANNGTNFIRSTTPFNFQTTDYTFSQAVLSNGGILTTLTPRTGGTSYADLGFGYTFGTLGSITSISITGTGTYSVNMYVDTNTANDANGPFFGWSGNTYTGTDGDTYGLGPSITGNGAITTASSFFMVNGAYSGQTLTIAQLQADYPSTTLVGFWFGVTNHPTTAQFEIDGINGVSAASSPVGGVWTPITLQTAFPMNTLQIMAPWIALALAAIASALVATRRLLKKHT